MSLELEARPLTRAAFAPFGDVIDTDDADSFLINDGSTRRFHDLARVDVASQDGIPLLSIFRGDPFELPLDIVMMERHPLGSQAFMPLSRNPFVVVVASADAKGRPMDFAAFVATPGQGVNYARNTWHHPLIALGETSDFLVVDRGGPGNNLDITAIEPALRLNVPAM